MSTEHPVVMITGGSSGIGLATAYAYSHRGARLFLVGRSAARMRESAPPLSTVVIEADVTVPSQVLQAAQTVEAVAGRVDLLINCAGQLKVGPAADLGWETARRLMEVNFFGTVATIHAVLPLLRRSRRAAIINVSSLAGRLAPPFMAAYAASKFALNGYTHSLRQELRPEGIHVGLVQPGPVDTPMTRGTLGGEHYPLPPGMPVLRADRVARAIVLAVERRLAEVVLPRRLSLGARLGSAYPGVVDLVYQQIRGVRAGGSAEGSGGAGAPERGDVLPGAVNPGPGPLASAADPLGPQAVLDPDDWTEVGDTRFGTPDSVLWWDSDPVRRAGPGAPPVG